MTAHFARFIRPANPLIKNVAAIVAGWNAFWFTPIDPAPLCLLRVLVGGMLVYSHCVWGFDLEGLIGPNGWNSAELIQQVQRDTWAFSFWWLVPTKWYWTVHVVCLGLLTLFWIGCWTRITSIFAFAILISYCNRAQLTGYGFDQIAVILTMYLMIGPSGAMYSVDSLFRRRRVALRALASGETEFDLRVSPSWTAGLALRLAQFHYCVIYFFAGLSKLQGRSWWTGESIWRAFANYEYQSCDMTWLASQPWLIQLITMVVVGWEVSFAYLIWSRRLRPLILSVGLLMHFGIGACMGMWTFGLTMMFGYLSFCPASTIRVLMGSIYDLCVGWPPMTIVIGSSSATLRRVAWIKSFDENDRIQVRFEGIVTQLIERTSLEVAVPKVISSAIHELVCEENQRQINRPKSPFVLYINSEDKVRQVMVRYLNSHGYEAVGFDSLVKAVPVYTKSRVHAIIFSGTVRSTGELEAFHASWKESESSTVICYILNTSAARELKPLFDSNASSVMELPVSLRQVRVRLDELITDSTIPVELVDSRTIESLRREPTEIAIPDHRELT